MPKMNKNLTEKIFQIILYAFLIIIFVVIIAAGIFSAVIGGSFYTPSKHKQFKTQYTEQEHIERISAETEKIIKRDWFKLYKTKVVDYSVEIVYSFYDNDPEYFLVTLELDREKTDVDAMQYLEGDCSAKYSYILGFIVKDEYKIQGGFEYGKSIYDVLGYSNAKKFYGNKAFGVETENGEILLLKDNVECCFKKDSSGYGYYAPRSIEFNYHYHLERKHEIEDDVCYKQRVLTKDEQKALMGWGYYDYEFRNYKAKE